MNQNDNRNPYFEMPIDRVQHDAQHGVAAARAALRLRAPALADRLLGRVVDGTDRRPRR